MTPSSGSSAESAARPAPRPPGTTGLRAPKPAAASWRPTLGEAAVPFTSILKHLRPALGRTALGEFWDSLGSGGLKPCRQPNWTTQAMDKYRACAAFPGAARQSSTRWLSYKVRFDSDIGTPLIGGWRWRLEEVKMLGELDTELVGCLRGNTTQGKDVESTSGTTTTPALK